MGEKGAEYGSSAVATALGGPFQPGGTGLGPGGKTLERPPNLEAFSKEESLGFLDKLLGWGGEQVKAAFEDYSKEQLTKLIDAYMSGAVDLVHPGDDDEDEGPTYIGPTTPIVE